MELTRADREHIKETLLACYAEFEELSKTKEWYVSDIFDQIESSLEILENIKEDNKNDKSEDLVLGSRNQLSKR